VTTSDGTNPAPKEKRPASRWRRWGRRALRIVVVAYLAACVILTLVQNWLLFPGAYFHSRKTAVVYPAPGRELLTLDTPDGHRIAAVFGAALNPDGSPRADAGTRPTLIYFYGNGDCLYTSMDQFEEFRRLGANVLIPEYVGYPMSGGKPGEAGIYATADAAYGWLIDRPDVDKNQIIAVGRSIGSGAAVDLASRKPLAGLATFSAFTSMDEMAQKVLPIFPTRLFLRHHFRNEEKIAQVRCPIFLAHGTKDTLVPFSMMARLKNKAGGPVTLYEIVGADHNDIFLVGGDKLLEKFGEFIEQVHSGFAPKTPDRVEVIKTR
jgi:fermentation-respiration switch protein FrsA (DUF1100 family)